MEEKQFSQVDAQHRVDQIHAFQQELAELEIDGVLTIPSEQASKVQDYHSLLLQNRGKIIH